jgi:hypothetical protein
MATTQADRQESAGHGAPVAYTLGASWAAARMGVGDSARRATTDAWPCRGEHRRAVDVERDRGIDPGEVERRERALERPGSELAELEVQRDELDIGGGSRRVLLDAACAACSVVEQLLKH